MTEIIYENHNHVDPELPIIFHLDTLPRVHDQVLMHYHENIEILYILQGTGIVGCEAKDITVKEGDIVIINSNKLHGIHSTASTLRYYCLIIDKTFCENSHIPIGQILLQDLIQDHHIATAISSIAQEMSIASPYYKVAIKSYVLQLLVHLCRDYALVLGESYETRANPKILIVKNTIHYIKQHFLKTLTIEEICQYVGFSKFYLCRVFKEITGQTLLDYINYLRCDHARKLLCSGSYNVSEAAEHSGFNNLSYFSKTYKKYMGKLPSSEN